jgi:hypothetical protein
VYTKGNHWSISRARRFQSIPHPNTQKSILISSSHLRLNLYSYPFPSRFTTKTFMHYTCPAHLIFLIIILITSGEEYKFSPVHNFFFYLCGGTLGTEATTGLLYQLRMIGDGDCGEIGGMKIGRGNRSTRRKPAPAPLLSITKSHMTRPGFEPGMSQWEGSD